MFVSLSLWRELVSRSRPSGEALARWTQEHNRNFWDRFPQRVILEIRIQLRTTKDDKFNDRLSGLPKYPEMVGNSVNVFKEYFLIHLHDPICLGGPLKDFYSPKIWRIPKQFAKISKNTPIDSF